VNALWHPRRGGWAVLLPALVIVAAAAGALRAQPADQEPAALAGLGIFHQAGAQVPTALAFTDQQGRAVQLGDYFAGERPVILTLVYYNCPMLCNVLLDRFVAGLKELEWTAGQEFTIVTVSIDPRDDTAGALKKQAHQIENYGRPSATTGWHFLTGEQAAITAVADAVGFKYDYDTERGEYMHAAGIFVLTPAGKVSQTLLGLDFPAKDLRLALVEASAGKIGSALDRALLFCFHYDAAEGRYAPAAMNLMRLGGGVCALVLALWLTTVWRRDRRRRLVAEGSHS
jgi:protein SCO1/2